MTTVSSTTSSSYSSTTQTSSSSSFDTKSLVEAKLQSRRDRISRMEKESKAYETKITAYKDLRSKLTSLQTSLAALRSAPGSEGKEADVFLNRKAYLTTSGSGTASNYLSATVKDGTNLGSHSISISQVAKSNIVTTAAQASKSTSLGWSGGFSLGTSGGKTANINVTTSMSLADIANAINAEKSTTGVVASVMKVSANKFKLVLTTSETGKTITAKDNTGSSLLRDTSKLGLLDGTGAIATSNVQQKAQSAILTVDGVKVTRDSNDIDDVLSGVTLHIYAPTTGSNTLKLEVDHDLSGIKSAISTFVEKYNALREIAITNQTTSSSGTASDSATLFGDLTLRSIMSSVQGILSGSVDTKSLGEIGLSFDSNNKLVINDTKLSSALLDKFDSIQTLFSYKVTTSSGDIGLVRHPNRAFDFKLNVSVDSSGNLTSADVGGDTSLFTVNGSSIRGKKGTIYEGLTFVYTGTTSKSISIKMSQGIADQMYYAADTFANSKDGTLTELLETLTTSNKDLEKRVETLTASTEKYSTYLYQMYAKMAARISEANTTLNLLKTLLKASSDD